MEEFILRKGDCMQELSLIDQMTIALYRYQA